MVLVGTPLGGGAVEGTTVGETSWADAVLVWLEPFEMLPGVEGGTVELPLRWGGGGSGGWVTRA